MPTATINGVDLFYEITGEGYPVVFSHEFAGDYKSWDPQVKFLARRYRCITYSNRGYPPSAVPTDPAAYSEGQLVDDLYQLVRHLGIEQAHFVGISMGGQIVLNFALAHPELCRSIVCAGTGSGSTNREQFIRDGQKVMDILLNQGMEVLGQTYTSGPTRLPFKRKDPKGWQEFHEQFAQHSAQGSALTFRGVQLSRPTVFDLKDKLPHLVVPTLILLGDEDEPCIDASVFLKREIRSAGLQIIPKSGHTLNLEEPEAFNRAVLDFLTTVEAGKWSIREAVTTTLFPL